MSALQAFIFDFLKELKDNNNRPWFQENKERFLVVKENMQAFSNELLNAMSHHDEIERMKIYRIYRDIRFSKDKTPYKAYLSGHFVRATKALRGGYYFHIEPNNSFVGGGFWNPSSPDLKRIRQDIASDPEQLRSIINAPQFKKTFGTLDGNQVKTAPKGYKKDHPAIDLLRYKQFLISHKFTDKEVLAPDFAAKASKVFEEMRPFFNYMSEVLTTDENGVPIV